MVGLIKAGGLSARELELAIADKLKFYIKDPQVTVAIAERHSRTVSLAGAVNNPGVHQVEGPQRLMEVLSMAGGLRPDAGATARITRQSEWGEIPLPNARRDLSGKFSVADVDLDSLMRGRNPEQNILIQPHDVIAVTKADLIFVLGEVKKPGGFPLMAHEKMSILSALGLAEGLFPECGFEVRPDFARSHGRAKPAGDSGEPGEDSSGAGSGCPLGTERHFIDSAEHSPRFRDQERGSGGDDWHGPRDLAAVGIRQKIHG